MHLTTHLPAFTAEIREIWYEMDRHWFAVFNSVFAIIVTGTLGAAYQLSGHRAVVICAWTLFVAVCAAAPVCRWFSGLFSAKLEGEILFTLALQAVLLGATAAYITYGATRDLAILLPLTVPALALFLKAAGPEFWETSDPLTRAYGDRPILKDGIVRFGPDGPQAMTLEEVDDLLPRTPR